MQTEFVKNFKEADEIYSFFFSKPGYFSYDAGDFTELSLDYGDIGGRRWFTIASSPEEELLQFTTKLPPDHSEFKKTLVNLKLGDEATLSPALGNFNLPRDKQEKLLFVAGGIGITPFRSMLMHLINIKETRDIELIYISKEKEYLFKDVLGESTATVRYETSKFDISSIKDTKRTIYLSGPEPMIKKYFEDLLSYGVHRSKILLDYFPGYDQL